MQILTVYFLSQSFNEREWVLDNFLRARRFLQWARFAHKGLKVKQRMELDDAQVKGELDDIAARIEVILKRVEKFETDYGGGLPNSDGKLIQPDVT